MPTLPPLGTLPALRAPCASWKTASRSISGKRCRMSATNCCGSRILSVKCLAALRYFRAADDESAAVCFSSSSPESVLFALRSAVSSSDSASASASGWLLSCNAGVTGAVTRDGCVTVPPGFPLRLSRYFCCLAAARDLKVLFHSSNRGSVTPSAVSIAHPARASATPNPSTPAMSSRPSSFIPASVPSLVCSFAAPQTSTRPQPITCLAYRRSGPLKPSSGASRDAIATTFGWFVSAGRMTIHPPSERSATATSRALDAPLPPINHPKIPRVALPSTAPHRPLLKSTPPASTRQTAQACYQFRLQPRESRARCGSLQSPRPRPRTRPCWRR